MRSGAKAGFFAVLVLTGISTEVLAAPFCAVFSFGRQCYYFDVQSCRQAAGTSGICTANKLRLATSIQAPLYRKALTPSRALQITPARLRRTTAGQHYGPIAGDPDSALKLQEYGQPERTNPIAVEQRQADLLAQKLRNANAETKLEIGCRQRRQ